VDLHDLLAAIIMELTAMTCHSIKI